MNSRPDSRRDQPATPLADGCAFALEHIEGFVLDALDRFERGLVEHHLRWCASCQAQASSFEQAVDFLPYATLESTEPAPETKERLFERIRDDAASAEAARFPDPPPAARVQRVRDPERTADRPVGWSRYANAALIAPLALALLVMGVWANSMRTDLNEQRSDLESQSQLNQALASGGQVALYSVEKEASCPTCHGTGQLGMSESNDMGMVLGWNFDPGKRHDVWGVNQDGDPMKMCELQVDPTGSVMQMFTFPDAPSSFTEVYITDEHGEMTYVSHLARNGVETPADDRQPASPTS